MKRQYLKMVFFCGTSLLTLLLVLTVLTSSIKSNAIILNYNIPFKNKINALAPQGWAFFTKDINKDYFNIYEVKNKKIHLVSVKSSSASQYFGIIRDNRMINHKLGSVIANIEPELWYKYKGELNKINLDSLSKTSIKVKKPMIYGIFLIEKGTPLPFAWYNSDLNFHRTMNYIILEIKR
jgi:antimicrobial peptide system SdpA family protein